MLVLSRKLGEQIKIGDNIVITVVEIDRGKIRLGIDAPRDVIVARSELLPIAEQEKMRSASLSDRDRYTASPTPPLERLTVVAPTAANDGTH